MTLQEWVLDTLLDISERAKRVRHYHEKNDRLYGWLMQAADEADMLRAVILETYKPCKTHCALNQSIEHGCNFQDDVDPEKPSDFDCDI